jgi:hypothetical protein
MPSSEFLNLLGTVLSKIGSPPPSTVSVPSAVRLELINRFGEAFQEWPIADDTAITLSAFACRPIISVEMFRLPRECIKDRSRYELAECFCLPGNGQWFDRSFRPVFTTQTDRTPLVESTISSKSQVNGINVLCMVDEEGLSIGGLLITWKSVRFALIRSERVIELFLEDGQMFLIDFDISIDLSFVTEHVTILTLSHIQTRFESGQLSIVELAFELSFLAGNSFNTSSPPEIPDISDLPTFIRDVLSFPIDDPLPSPTFEVQPFCVGQVSAGVITLLAQKHTIFVIDSPCGLSGFRLVLPTDDPQPTLETILRYRADVPGARAVYLPAHGSLGIARDCNLLIHFIVRGKRVSQTLLPVSGSISDLQAIGDDFFVAISGSILVVVRVGHGVVSRTIFPGECIACFGACEHLGVIVICDVRSRITVADLSNGRKLREFRIQAVPYRLLVLDNGRIVAVVRIGVRTAIRVYDFDGRLLNRAMFDGAVVEASVIALQTYRSLMAVSFDDNRVDIIGTESLEVVRTFPVNNPCKFMSYDSIRGMFVFMRSEKLISVLFIKTELPARE